ncbi:DUF3180 domain-containing protein [Nocardioides sp.]|uniref:DUF3180 domain-containing protein n=1 Tax=Nocardioides sp. TaxID=35761 RepID=UPI002719A569|nr:DUF3180 domain-containing protein [Nocardioides sp.]MDO9457467.1 DUF3180 domain-containing protein [Nocardioides sp.]
MTAPPDGGRLQPTRPPELAGWGLVGLVLGLLVRPVWERLDDTAPVVTWAQPLGLFLVAAVVAGTAWSTWRTVHVRRERLEPHRAVNRLVLARAVAVAGAFVGGGYLGYAASWLGDASPLADERLVRGGLAALGGLLAVVASLLLERACRVRSDD